MTTAETKITVLSIRYDYTDYVYAYSSQEGRTRTLLRFLKTLAKKGYFGEPIENTHVSPRKVLTPEELSYYNLSADKINELPEEIRAVIREKRDDAIRAYNRAQREHENKIATWKPIRELINVSEDEAIKTGADAEEIRHIVLSKIGYDRFEEYEGVELTQ